MVNHQPDFIAPWYANTGDVTMLHRYMKEDFIQSFQKEATQQKLKSYLAETWLQEDKFGGSLTRLRLPIHRTFYVVSTEIVCDTLFKPAFSSRNIISAGFVVRKSTAGKMQTWQLRDGDSIGWKDINELDRELDPDHSKRKLTNSNIKWLAKPAEENATGFTGEQTYPLHCHTVKAAEKNHSVLYGYLPLSGKLDAQEVMIQSVSQNPEVSAAGYLAELEWPFGSWDGVKTDAPVCDCTGSLAEIAVHLCEHFDWGFSASYQILGGQPTRAMANWLAMLINRYQIFDETIAENSSLRNLLKSIPLLNRGLNSAERDLLDRSTPEFLDYVNSKNIVQGNLWNYLRDHYADIMKWFSEETTAYSAQPAKPAVWKRLPNNFSHLYLQSHQAESIRLAMLQRAEKINQLIEAELPVPRYTQGKDEGYFVVPFVRYRDDCGCEKLQWGKASMQFTVANPLDPLAVRPTVVQLPELSDITKGFAKGVTFLTPKSIADMMNKVSPDMEMKEVNSKSPLNVCMGFSISFSIPIITICAMIILMIVLGLLNLIFRWIPYAILVLPRLCGVRAPSP